MIYEAEPWFYQMKNCMWGVPMVEEKYLEFGMFYLRSSILFKCGEIHHGENYRGDAKYIQSSLINVNEIF